MSANIGKSHHENNYYFASLKPEIKNLETELDAIEKNMLDKGSEIPFFKEFRATVRELSRPKYPNVIREWFAQLGEKIVKLFRPNLDMKDFMHQAFQLEDYLDTNPPPPNSPQEAQDIYKLFLKVAKPLALFALYASNGRKNMLINFRDDPAKVINFAEALDYYKNGAGKETKLRIAYGKDAYQYVSNMTSNHPQLRYFDVDNLEAFKFLVEYEQLGGQHEYINPLTDKSREEVMQRHKRFVSLHSQEPLSGVEQDVYTKFLKRLEMVGWRLEKNKVIKKFYHLALSILENGSPTEKKVLYDEFFGEGKIGSIYNMLQLKVSLVEDYLNDITKNLALVKSDNKDIIIKP